MDQKNTAYFTYFGGICNLALLVSAITLWIISSAWYPNVDGVSVYEMFPIYPDRNLFKNLAGKSNAEKVFAAETQMLNYCVFPKVYNELIKRNPALPGDITGFLKTRGLSQSQAEQIEGVWVGIAGDFSAIERTNTEYNIAYDDLVVPAGKTEPSSRFFPPVCRCMNKVLAVFETKPNTNEEFDKALGSIDNCLRTQYLTKRQTLLGPRNDNKQNNDIRNRKFISRYALLFQLCFVFAIGYFYNKIDFMHAGGSDCCSILGHNWMSYAGLLAVFLFMWLGYAFSAVTSISADNALSFSTLIALPALAIGALVEIIWSNVANQVDVGRQTFMHPLGFFFTMSSLCTIALIENGVFTMSVIVTHIFYCNVMSMAYAGLLFVAHGRLWKSSSSSRTGFFLLIFLPATSQMFYLTPAYPVNCQLNLLWFLPVVFAVLCFAKIIFIDHFLEDESNMDSEGRFKVTHSDHLFSMVHVLLVGIVVIYYITQLGNMSYAKPESHMMSMNGGKLTTRLNFELGEFNAVGQSRPPAYNSIDLNTSGVYFFNP